MAQSKGRGFAAPNLYRFVQFYKAFPEIFSTASRKSEGLLTWSHYTELLRVTSKEARDWYETEAAAQNWSVRTLQRNIDTLYYERLLMSQNSGPVVAEMQEKTSEYQVHRLEFIKNPVIAEFLGVPQEEELRAEIENQKTMFALQHGMNGEAIDDEG